MTSKLPTGLALQTSKSKKFGCAFATIAMNLRTIWILASILNQFVTCDLRTTFPETPTPVSVAAAQLIRDFFLPTAKATSVTSEASFNENIQNINSKEIISEVMHLTTNRLSYRFVSFTHKSRVSKYRFYHLFFVESIEGLE